MPIPTAKPRLGVCPDDWLSQRQQREQVGEDIGAGAGVDVNVGGLAGCSAVRGEVESAERHHSSVPNGIPHMRIAQVMFQVT